MPATVPIKPELIRWAVERSRLSAEELTGRFPKLDQWQRGERQPTLKQLEALAGRTMTPLGYFFLAEPPDETLPIPDFRTADNGPITRPSPNLIDTVQAMQRRQQWMREYLIDAGQDPLPFVGSAGNSRDVVSVAARIRQTLGLDVDWAESHATWEDALRTLRGAAEQIGILVAGSGIVGLNTHRALDPQEFRGFVLCDDYAPLIFVNGADSKSAQMFTLAHELAHVWVGRGGLFNLIQFMPHPDSGEQFCNRTAAEFLVPAHKIKARWTEARATGRPFHELGRRFKVSPVVAARRALDLRLIARAEFFAFYEHDREEWLRRKEAQRHQKRSGGNFYATQDQRLGRRFAWAVVRAAREGRLSYREAYKLTDLKGETFHRYANLLTERIKDERR